MRCSEAEALLRLRLDAEATLRTHAREIQRSLADAHTSLDSFVTQQQARRGRELAGRQRQLAAWDGQLAKLAKLLELSAGSARAFDPDQPTTNATQAPSAR